jgi:serralysin
MVTLTSGVRSCAVGNVAVSGEGLSAENELAGLDPALRGLLSARRWRDATVTVALPETASAYEAGYSAANEPRNGFAPLTGRAAEVVRQALAAYEAVSGLELVEPAPGFDATIRLAGSAAPTIAWAYPPADDERAGDVWFDLETGPLALLSAPQAPLAGGYAWHTVLHEIGHALGLKHGHEGEGQNVAALPEAADTMEFTIMTYRSYAGQPIVGSYLNEPGGYAQGLMPLDIAAIQHLYGVNTAFRGGDTHYALSPETGALIVDGTAEPAPIANRVFRTLWDGGGVDTLDLSAYATPLRLDLSPFRSAEAHGGIDLDVGGTSQRARLDDNGGALARAHLFLAPLTGGNPAGLIENGIGGRGDDLLIGNQADNRLEGGPGQDRYRGGAGADVFGGTLGEISGDTIEDFAAEDRVEITGVSLPLEAGIAPTPEGVAITLGPVALSFDALPAERVFALDHMAETVQLALASHGALLTGPAGERVTIGPAASAIRVQGGDGPDLLAGGDGDDALTGGRGSDLLLGGNGNDTLVGGGGDVLTGGAGSDVFVFTATDGNGIMVVTDFDPAVDRIDGHGLEPPVMISAGALHVAVEGGGVLLPGLGEADLPAVTAALGEGLPRDHRLLGLHPQRTMPDSSGRWLARGDAAVTLTGGLGDDTLAGASGDDLILGGAGDNQLWGGPGSDTFRFRLDEAGSVTEARRDVIMDFDPAADRIDLVGLREPLGFEREADGLAFALTLGWRVLLRGVDEEPEMLLASGLFA